MSQILPINPSVRYAAFTAAAGQTQFPGSFPLQSKQDVRVFRTRGGTLTELVDFEATGIGATNGFGVVLASPCLLNDRVELVGEALLARVSSIVRSGRFASRPVDDDLDRLTLIAQELNREQKRGLKWPRGEAADQLPATADRVDRFMRFDRDGKLQLTSHDELAVEMTQHLLSRVEGAIADIAAGNITFREGMIRAVDSAVVALSGALEGRVLADGSNIDGQFVDVTETTETKAHGATSKARTQRARWGDTLDMREFLDGGGGAGSSSADGLALNALIAHLNANPHITTVKGHKGDVCRLSGFSARVLGKRHWMFDGARIVASGVNTAVRSPMLWFEGGTCQGLDMTLEGAAVARRILHFDGVQISNVKLVAEAQVADTSGGNLYDNIVNIYGDNNAVRVLRIENFDRPLLILGDQYDLRPAEGNSFHDLTIRNYCGVGVRNQKDITFVSADIQGRSPNALEDPGFVGLGFGSIVGMNFIGGIIADAGEHNMRFGGRRGAEPFTKNVIIVGTRLERSGQTAFKMFTASKDEYYENFTVTGLQIRDCQYSPQAPSTIPAFNDHGMLIQQVRKSKFSGINIGTDVWPWCGHDGIYGSGLQDVGFIGCNVQNAYRNSLRLSQFHGGVYSEWPDGTPQEEDMSGVYVQGLTASGHRQSGVVLDFPNRDMRDIEVDGNLVGNSTTATSFPAVVGIGGTARYKQQVRFNIAQRNHSQAFTYAGGANVIARDRGVAPIGSIEDAEARFGAVDTSLGNKADRTFSNVNDVPEALANVKIRKIVVDPDQFDGATDHAKITAAIAYLHGVGGGTLNLTRTYLTTSPISLTGVANVSIRGYGAKIKLTRVANGPQFFAGTGPKNVSIFGLQFEGSYSENGFNGHIISFINPQSVTVKDIESRNNGSGSILFFTDDYGASGVARDNVVTDSVFYGGGVLYESLRDSWVQNCRSIGYNTGEAVGGVAAWPFNLKNLCSGGGIVNCSARGANVAAFALTKDTSAGGVDGLGVRNAVIRSCVAISCAGGILANQARDCSIDVDIDQTGAWQEHVPAVAIAGFCIGVSISCTLRNLDLVAEAAIVSRSSAVSVDIAFWDGVGWTSEFSPVLVSLPDANRSQNSIRLHAWRTTSTLIDPFISSTDAGGHGTNTVWYAGGGRRSISASNGFVSAAIAGDGNKANGLQVGSSNKNITLFSGGLGRLIYSVAGSALTPATDGDISLGSTTARWNVVYAATGAINTSDERTKDNIRPLNAAEIAAARAIIHSVRIFQFRDAVALKGAEARLHSGWIAQEVVTIMAAHGLDPFRYSFVCFDEWEEEPEEIIQDEIAEGEFTTQVVRPARPAGNQYGLRMDGLLAFCMTAVGAGNG